MLERNTWIYLDAHDAKNTLWREILKGGVKLLQDVLTIVIKRGYFCSNPCKAN